MLRSNFKPLQRLPATEALERFLVQEEDTPSAAGEKNASLALSKASEDFAFPSIGWGFPEDDDEDAAVFGGLKASDPFQSDMSLCSKGSASFASASDMSLDSFSLKNTLKRRDSGASKGSLQRSKRLASELHMLRSDADEPRPTKRRSF